MGDEAQQQQRDGAALHGDGIALLPQHSRQDAIIHVSGILLLWAGGRPRNRTAFKLRTAGCVRCCCVPSRQHVRANPASEPPSPARPPTRAQLRSRHRDNVLALLHASLLRGRYATAAGAVAALLAADTFAPDHNPRPAARGSRARDERRARRTGDVVWAALDLLRRHGAPPDQVAGLEPAFVAAVGSASALAYANAALERGPRPLTG